MVGAARGSRIAALLALGAATVALAGCGGGGGKGTTAATPATTSPAAVPKPLAKDAYVKQMQTLGKSLSASLNLLTSASTPKKAAAALTTIQTGLRGTAGKLALIGAPAQVRAQHAKLVRGVRDFADELTPIIARLRKGKMAALQTLPGLKGIQEIQSASAAITKKGFPIGG